MKKISNSDILLSITFVTGLFVLILNDFVLKQTFSNDITGKLSDLAGLFIFPMFLTFLFPNFKKANYFLTLILFILWKLPITDSLINVWNSWNIFNVNRVIDYTDYFTLLTLPISYFHKPKTIKIPIRRLAINGISVLAFFAFCSTAGTHGSIKGYEYSTSKVNLEKAILEVIKENPSINRSESNSENDYYNEDGYITITINAPDKYSYTFRFFGGEEHWKNSPNKSEIFICYAHDNKGNGGSEGGGGVEWYKWGVKSKLTEYFEKNFISKLDKKLNSKHIDKE
jgi:hypothetical protein